MVQIWELFFVYVRIRLLGNSINHIKFVIFFYAHCIGLIAQ